jgi:hypothetical protein
MEKVGKKEKAIFEAGIKLGALYHQWVGTPVSEENVREIELAIESSVLQQPWVEKAEVRIDRERMRKKEGRWGYCDLSGDLLQVEIQISYENFRVIAGMKYKDGYPLMEVREIKIKKQK